MTHQQVVLAVLLVALVSTLALMLTMGAPVLLTVVVMVAASIAYLMTGLAISDRR